MLATLRHFLFAPSRDYPFTAPVHFHLKKDGLSNVWGWKPWATYLYANRSLRQKHTFLEVNERIIEVPWIFNSLNFQKPGKVLDVGWLESSVPLSLATAGFEVTGIDIRKGDISHPNLTQLQADICNSGLPKSAFDVVMMLSTMEHIGLDTLYGKAGKDSSDQKAIDECLRVLKPNGKLLITTPVARTYYQDTFMRRYTTDRLKNMLKSATITELRYFKPNQNQTVWREVAENELPEAPQFGVALLSVQKKYI